MADKKASDRTIKLLNELRVLYGHSSGREFVIEIQGAARRILERTAQYGPDERMPDDMFVRELALEIKVSAGSSMAKG
jgi:hypothetical protein